MIKSYIEYFFINTNHTIQNTTRKNICCISGILNIWYTIRFVILTVFYIFKYEKNEKVKGEINYVKESYVNRSLTDDCCQLYFNRRRYCYGCVFL